MIARVFQCRRVCLKTSGRVAMATSVSRVAMSTTRTCTNKTNWMTSPDTPLFQPLARRAHLPLRTETTAFFHSTAKWFISFYISTFNSGSYLSTTCFTVCLGLHDNRLRDRSRHCGGHTRQSRVGAAHPTRQRHPRPQHSLQRNQRNRPCEGHHEAR